MSFLFHVLRTSLLPLLMILAHFAAAAPRNVTIDDEYGDERTLEVPRYAPDGGWAQGSGCPGCLQLDDKSRAIRGTWHDSTHHPNDPTRNITFNFNGSAIYVYCIIANKYKEGVDTLASYTFTIDGDLVGRFDHAPEDTPSFYYNSLVYHNSSIPPGPHTFSFIADSQENTTLILFDYAQYTVEIEDPPSNVAANSPTNTTQTLDTNTTDTTTPMGRQPSTQQIAEIVAGVLGGVSVVGLGFILYLLRHRIRRKKSIDQNPEAALRARPTRPTVSTSPANRPDPPRQPSNPGPDAITPFLAFTPFQPRPEKGSQEHLDLYASTSPSTAPPPSTPTSSSNSGPSSRPQVSLENRRHPPQRSRDHPSDSRRRRRRRFEESSSGTSTTHSSGRSTESRPSGHTHRTNSPRGRPGASGSTGRLHGVSSPSPLGPDADEVPPPRRPRASRHHSDDRHSPRRGAGDELLALRRELHDLREQQQLMISTLQPEQPPPSYDDPPTPGGGPR